MNSTALALLPLSVVVGVAAGFAVPLVASYQAKIAFEVPSSRIREQTDTHDSEVARLVARNRRLEALVADLRRKNAELISKPVLAKGRVQY